MQWQTTTACHIGGRPEQQDRVAVFADEKKATCLLVVADGMGGHEGGSLAAQAVINCADELWRAAPPPALLLKEICVQSHLRINNIGMTWNISPHSTCVLLYLADNHAWWTHLGDSRLYHFRGRRLVNRTRDHSVVQMLVDMGKISEEEMGTHRDQGRLLKGLGGEEAPEPHISDAPVEPGDGFLLCSDGLWERITLPEASACLREPDLAVAVQEMVNLAVERGGTFGDNVSVAVAVN